MHCLSPNFQQRLIYRQTFYYHRITHEYVPKKDVRPQRIPSDCMDTVKHVSLSVLVLPLFGGSISTIIYVRFF